MRLNRKPKAKVAIVVRTKDRPYLLNRALASIVKQSYTDWIALIMNDGGDSQKIIETLSKLPKEAQRKCFVHEVSPAIGIVNGRPLNIAIKQCQSDWIAIHDDDDSWDPEFLEKMLAACDKAKKVAAVCQAYQIFEKWNGSEYLETSRTIYQPWQTQGISLFRLAESNTFAPISLLYHRSVLKQIGDYAEDLDGLEDWDFNLRLLSTFEIEFVASPLSNYHFREAESRYVDQNSLVKSKDHYGKMDIKLRNRLLKNDLAKGKMGLGWLVNFGRSHGQIFQLISSEKQSK